MKVKTASVLVLAAAIVSKVSGRRVLQQADVVGVQPTDSSTSSTGSTPSTTADKKEILQAIEDDHITVVSPIEYGELLCDTLVEAEDADSLSFVLLDGETITADQTSYAVFAGATFTDGIGRMVWTGVVTDPPQGADEAIPKTVSMTWGEVCSIETFLFKVTNMGVDETTSIVQTVPCLDTNKLTCLAELSVEFGEPAEPLLPPDSTTTLTELDDQSGGDGDSSDPARRLDDNGGRTQIDVMVLYSSLSLSLFGGISSQQMETTITGAIAQTNDAFVNSEVDLIFNAVHIGPLPYEQTSSVTDTNLIEITSNQEVAALRDSTGADLVQMVGDFGDGFCGRGWLFNGNAAFGFNVVDVGCIIGGTTATSVFGSNLGCLPNREDTTVIHPFSYGFRYCSGLDPYRTIMSNSCGSPHVNYFSNPDVIVLDKPTGTPTDDNARIIEKNMGIICEFREIPPTPPPTTVPPTTMPPTTMPPTTMPPTTMPPTPTPPPTTMPPTPTPPPTTGVPTTAPPTPTPTTATPTTAPPTPPPTTGLPTTTPRPTPATGRPTSPPTTGLPIAPPTTAPTTESPICASIPEFTLMECYGDDTRNRVLSGKLIRNDQTMTTEVCAMFCQGSPYFGTEFGQECFCGVDSDDPAELGPANCTSDCAGDVTQTCGGSNAISVYTYGTVEADFLGCWTDTSDNRIMGCVESDSSMTIEICEEICIGFPFFGTQNGQECWCGDASTDFMANGASGSCNLDCAGDPSQTCGGFFAMSVYQHDPVVRPTNSLGCWTDTAEERIMDFKKSSPSMTNDLCQTICSSSSYDFYGTQFGSECWCGDASTDITIHGQSNSCNIECSGDPSMICGGFFAMSVWEYV